MSKEDYYNVLGVEKGASKDEIKKAYRKKAMKFHPDRNPDDSAAEAKFKEASEAAQILLDDSKRQRYDQFGHAGVNNQAGGGGFGGAEGFSDLGDIFGDIFGDLMGGGRRSSGRGRSNARHGADLQTSLSVSFEESAFGIEKTISVGRHIKCKSCNGSGAKKGSGPTTCSSCHGYGEIRRQQGFFTMSQACPTCQGSGQMIKDKCTTCRGSGFEKKNVDLAVKVPAGIDHGQRLKLSGEGDEGSGGGYPGNLYVVIEVKEHELFERDDFDIYCKVPITFSQAALGAKVEVPTLTGKVSVKIPVGTQSGKKMRLKGKGIARLGRYGFGDQILQLNVETPTHLSAEQKDLLGKLANLEQNQSNPLADRFFARVKDLFQ